ncbi:hypothetical protein ABIC83_002966 [Roseateles asaccharophilus]|uniref:hypothetical protein n=1 Tax=Roseateles asaccharophilus TaxID=582607 RepID=UPI0038363F4D
MADQLTLSGAELKRFLKDPLIWSNATSWDDTLILVDGRNADEEGVELEVVADGAKIEIETGYLVDPQPGVPDDLIDAIAWWRSKQTTVTYMVAVPREKAGAFEAALASMGLTANQS